MPIVNRRRERRRACDTPVTTTAGWRRNPLVAVHESVTVLCQLGASIDPLLGAEMRDYPFYGIRGEHTSETGRTDKSAARIPRSDACELG